jgi:nucleotide-binding universal stress UspA family protein
MFKNILIPTDGSRTASKAVRAGIAFAKKIGASVTGYSAFEPARATFNVSDLYYIDRGIAEIIEKYSRIAAKKNVARIGKLARQERVPFNLSVSAAFDPADGIIQGAKKARCDAIFIASHGHGPVVGLLLGSVTQKVLSRSRIPVVVYR